jgi:hypothetical protein
MMYMPSYSKHDVILVRYPFSDSSSSKVRPAVVVSTSHSSQGIGDGGNEDLARIARRHGNLTENAPIFLIALASLELVKEQIQSDRAYQLFLEDHRLSSNPTLRRLMLDE